MKGRPQERSPPALHKSAAPDSACRGKDGPQRRHTSRSLRAAEKRPRRASHYVTSVCDAFAWPPWFAGGATQHPLAAPGGARRGRFVERRGRAVLRPLFHARRGCLSGALACKRAASSAPGRKTAEVTGSWRVSVNRGTMRPRRAPPGAVRGARCGMRRGQCAVRGFVRAEPQPTHFLALRQSCIQGLNSLWWPLVQDIWTLRNTRSGCGIMAVKRPSAVVTAVRPPGLPFGLSG